MHIAKTIPKVVLIVAVALMLMGQSSCNMTDAEGDGAATTSEASDLPTEEEDPTLYTRTTFQPDTSFTDAFSETDPSKVLLWIMLDKTGGLVGGEEGALVRFDDGAWTNMDMNLAPAFTDCDAIGDDHFFMVGEFGGLFETTDGGVEFGMGMPPEMTDLTCAAAGSTGHVYIGGEGGTLWTHGRFAGDVAALDFWRDADIADIACDDDGTTVVVLDAGGGLSFSSDSGVTWEEPAFADGWDSVDGIDSAGDHLVVGGLLDGTATYVVYDMSGGAEGDIVEQPVDLESLIQIEGIESFSDVDFVSRTDWSQGIALAGSVSTKPGVDFAAVVGPDEVWSGESEREIRDIEATDVVTAYLLAGPVDEDETIYGGVVLNVQFD